MFCSLLADDGDSSAMAQLSSMWLTLMFARFFYLKGQSPRLFSLRFWPEFYQESRMRGYPSMMTNSI
jgi:hypothetical protein